MERGHAVDVAAQVARRLEAAFDAGALCRTPFLDRALADLALAVGADREAATEDPEPARDPEPVRDGSPSRARIGGKSGEAARMILRAIDRELDEA